jgi:4'-phosphopantetheinyl transferase
MNNSKLSNCELSFAPPPSDLELEAGQVHTWSASLDQPDLCFQILYETLSQDERDRAERFVFEKDRRHFAVCRGILRSIISRYVDVKASSISFMYGPNGKPALGDLHCGESLYFNLSHSEGLALYVFSRDQELGVDVECTRDINEVEQIAKRIFSKREIEIFLSLPEKAKKDAFFNCWTRKEAFVKALGVGLSLPLDNFEVTFIPVEQSRLIRVEGDINEISLWSVHDLKPANNYAGAFAIKKPLFETKCWQWDVRSVPLYPAVKDSGAFCQGKMDDQSLQGRLTCQQI